MIIKEIIKTIILLSLTLVLSSCGLLADVSVDKTTEGITNNTNANLSFLGISSGVLQPGFNQSVTSYNTEVNYTITSLNLQAQAVENNANIKINGIAYNFNANHGITLSEGTNTIEIIVSAPDSTTKKSYIVTINRLPLPTKANLSSITLSESNLSPSFNAGITSYIVYTYSITSLTVTPTVAEAGATVTVNGISVTSGNASQPINLNAGSPPNNITTIPILVTSQDGTDEKTYTLTVYAMAYTLSIIGYWPLNNSLNDSTSNFNGLWMGTYSSGDPNPEYSEEGDRIGVHFQYTAYQQTSSGSGDWIDFEKESIHQELNIDDYLTIMLWLFWDGDSLKLYSDGLPVSGEGNEYMNIISKSVWYEYGWQIRYEASSDRIELFIHHNNGYDLIPIVENFSIYRNSWMHLAVTIDNINRIIFSYVNGIATNSSPQNYTTPFVAVPENFSPTSWYTGHFSVGGFSHPWGGYTFNGKISDVHLFHGILNSKEINDIYEVK